MITKINTEISKKTNKRILDTLYEVHSWSFGFDIIKRYQLNRFNSGLIYRSYISNSDYINHEVLNTYAMMILDMVEDKSFLKFKKLYRIYWNWYCPGSVTEFHQDEMKDNSYSIIYNIHDNDGGTEFNLNNDIKFYKSMESEALLFPSVLYHRGVAPKQNPNRFAVNIIVEI